jgi:hypothetical protein
MKEFISPGLIGYTVKYDLDDLSFDCQLDRPIESVAPTLQHLFPPEREDFMTLKSPHDGAFIQIFFTDNEIIASLSGRFRMQYEDIDVPQILNAGDTRIVFEEHSQTKFSFRGSLRQKIVEIVLDDSVPQISFFRYAANVAAGVHDGTVRRLLFRDVAFIGRDAEVRRT